MSAIRISRSPDLAKLEAEGFRLRIVQGSGHHLLIEGIPAVTSKGEVALGTLYCPLVIDPGCDPRSEKPVPAVVEAQARVFRYPDMGTTRAGIGAATAKLLADRVAIIGLGGTGSYILDLLAKTPIGEIHLYDGDEFGL